MPAGGGQRFNRRIEAFSSESGPHKGKNGVAWSATKRSARTMGLDLKTHNIFMPAADFDPPAPGERRGKMKPDSFVIVVVGK